MNGTEFVTTIIVAMWLLLMGYLVGYFEGFQKGRAKAKVREVMLQRGEIKVTLSVSAVQQALDELDMVAMPKGVDFKARKEVH